MHCTSYYNRDKSIVYTEANPVSMMISASINVSMHRMLATPPLPRSNLIQPMPLITEFDGPNSSCSDSDFDQDVPTQRVSVPGPCDSVRLSVTQADAVQSCATQSNTIQSSTTQSNTIQSSTTQSVTIQSEATLSDTIHSSTTQKTTTQSNGPPLLNHSNGFTQLQAILFLLENQVVCTRGEGLDFLHLLQLHGMLQPGSTLRKPSCLVCYERRFRTTLYHVVAQQQLAHFAFPEVSLFNHAAFEAELNYCYLFFVFKRLLSSAHAQILQKALAFLYENYDFFNGAHRLQVLAPTCLQHSSLRKCLRRTLLHSSAIGAIMCVTSSTACYSTVSSARASPFCPAILAAAMS